MLEDSPFFRKCSQFHVDFRKAIKNPEKVFCSKDNGRVRFKQCLNMLRECLHIATRIRVLGSQRVNQQS